MTAEKGTPEKRVQIHNTPPQSGSWIWINRDAVDTPEVKPGDHVGFEAFGWTAFGVVTQCDEDGITISGEPPQLDREQVKEVIEHTGLHLSEWQTDYLTRQLQKRSDG